MATGTTLSIRNVEPHLKDALRVRAARHGRSMEAELRAILRDTLAGDRRQEADLFTALRRHVAPLGGIDLTEHPAVARRRPPGFD